ncbi:hypothetical protein AB4Z22_36135 [Paenibacillus sp. TAF58]
MNIQKWIRREGTAAFLLIVPSLIGFSIIGIIYSFMKYGSSIVQAAIHYLRKQSVRHIVIDTTPFVDFYGKLGYRTWKSYAKYAKALE